MAKNLYIGAKGTSSTTIDLTGSNINQIFTVETYGPYSFVYDGTNGFETNISDMLTSYTNKGTKLTALYDTTFTCSLYCSNGDYKSYFKVKHNGSNIVANTDWTLDEIGGRRTQAYAECTVELKAGDTLDFNVYSTKVDIEKTDYFSFDDAVCTYQQPADGFVARKTKKMYLGDGYARKVTKAYVGDTTNKARLFFSSGPDIAGMTISYSGTYTDRDVVMDSKTYRLLTMTTSGILSIPEEVKADIWLCGGGAAGLKYLRPKGGNGGFVNQVNSVTLPMTSIVCTIGAGGVNTDSVMDTSAFSGSASSIMSYSASGGQGGDPYSSLKTSGGSGGGGNGGYYATTGQGSGTPTIPFSYSELGKHSAGGGGGAVQVRDEDRNYFYYQGGAGGSNGSNGSEAVRISNSVIPGGPGGDFGGGTGGKCTNGTTGNGSSGYFYGSGGGGASTYDNEYSGSISTGKPGSGYQGVIYIRIPYEQE